MIARLLYLQPGELRRLLPFFGLYLLLFGALTLADGLSLALFVERVGADRLPTSYGLIAVANLLLIGGYILWAERVGSVCLFHLIVGSAVAVYGLAWLALRWLDGGAAWYGVLLVTREVALTLVLMHFGTVLQDYFTREEMNRVLPLIYSGGRVGGILGGWLLMVLTGPLGLLGLVLVFVGIGLACMLLLALIAGRLPHAHAPEDEQSDAGVSPEHRGGAELEQEARSSLAGFLRFAWASPLLFWTTVTSVLFVVCRWLLNYQYSSFFGAYFSDGAALARFLGQYTQAALVASLVLQVLVINRLVAWVGIKGAHFLYSALLVAALGMNLLPMTFAMAVFARLVETELRFGLRNPVMQMITNKYAKALRVRVRAWSLGLLIPLATLASSLVLGGLVRAQATLWVPWVGGGAGLAYLLSSLGLCRSFRGKPAPHSVRG